VETSENREKMTKAIDQAEVYPNFRRSRKYSSPDSYLIWAYTKKSKGLHVRKTLDQSHYSMLPTTEARDVDQILLKRREGRNPMKVVMVDQLWMWIFDGTSLRIIVFADI
jgi:hypothetical protein